MPLPNYSLSVENSNQNYLYFEDGLFVQKIKILEVIDASTYPMQNSEKKPNIALKIKYTVTDSKEPKTVYLFGSFQGEGKFDPISKRFPKYTKFWDTSFRNQVLVFFNETLDESGKHNIIDDNYVINSNVLLRYIGREYYLFKYFAGEKNGNQVRETYGIFPTIDEPKKMFFSLLDNGAFPKWRSYEKYKKQNQVTENKELNDGVPF